MEYIIYEKKGMKVDNTKQRWIVLQPKSTPTEDDDESKEARKSYIIPVTLEENLTPFYEFDQMDQSDQTISRFLRQFRDQEQYTKFQLKHDQTLADLFFRDYKSDDFRQNAIGFIVLLQYGCVSEDHVGGIFAVRIESSKKKFYFKFTPDMYKNRTAVKGLEPCLIYDLKGTLLTYASLYDLKGITNKPLTYALQIKKRQSPRIESVRDLKGVVCEYIPQAEVDEVCNHLRFIDHGYTEWAFHNKRPYASFTKEDKKKFLSAILFILKVAGLKVSIEVPFENYVQIDMYLCGVEEIVTELMFSVVPGLQSLDDDKDETLLALRKILQMSFDALRIDGFTMSSRFTILLRDITFMIYLNETKVKAGLALGATGLAVRKFKNAGKT